MDHRRAGTGGHGSGADDGTRAAALEPALRRALRAGALDTSAEQRAVAAFRAARAEGVHQRARRRDDWRSRHVPGRRSVRAAVAVLLAGLTFSGVAIAAIGSPESDGKVEDDGRVRRHPSPTAPQAPAPAPASAPASATTAPSGSGSPTPAPSGPGSPTPAPAPAPSVTRYRPPTAKDIQAHCRAYPSVKGSGKALESTAWKRFIEAAGGEDNVEAYCADQLSQSGTGNAGNAGKGNGSDGGSGPAKDNGQPNSHSTEQNNAKNTKNEQSGKNAKNEKPGQAGAAKTE
ncbi:MULTISPECIES: hypothetical protein [unclassified Streptomyces]|uniref:hypothetical protein n=1 Tax=unclassified Streptomyces TaxID=2593676 RepID=UPI0033F1C603